MLKFFDAALAGMAAPWIICAALVITTLLLEDLAIAAGVAVAAQGALSWPISFAAVAGGIALGDIGLYGFGLAATRVPWLQRRFVPARCAGARDRLLLRLPVAVLLARAIPGLRLLTYPVCGFLRVPLLRFGGWVGVGVLLWTGGLFWLGAALGDVLSTSFGIPTPIAAALPIIVLAAAIPLLRATRIRLQRKPT